MVLRRDRGLGKAQQAAPKNNKCCKYRRSQYGTTSSNSKGHFGLELIGKVRCSAPPWAIVTLEGSMLNFSSLRVGNSRCSASSARYSITATRSTGTPAPTRIISITQQTMNPIYHESKPSTR
ncbi:uncharacterized protein LOC129723395 [Wyeomyia smithii]|uniref:uncharacterized protein LOC129723395 n=1 Tax=Wyeomyia smithii TaxID=174621 RepID=UPI00246820CD|nr:uncharacterized protein LOC129723395 [Wyeomyia smithii]